MIGLSTDELIVDCFAGGGGASQGIFEATRRHPDVAINHDPEAVAMHAANHPTTRHYCKSIYHVDPDDIIRKYRRPIGLLWASPDCTHHSKARGGKPKQKHIRDLAWTVVLWAERAVYQGRRPRIICIENVEEFLHWGALDECGQPIKDLRGAEFKRWVAALRKLGYKVEWKELRACDYGAPTIRKRLFIVARCDGMPIVWPKPTHGPEGSELLPHRTAAECIDWSIPASSIFERKKPLAENTLRRVAKGVRRYTIDAAKPYVVANKVSPHLIPIAHYNGSNPVYAPEKPLNTITAHPKGGSIALVSAHLAQHNTMPNGGCHAGRDADAPMSTITASGSQQGLVTAQMARLFGTSDAASVEKALGTVTSKKKDALVTASVVKMRGENIGHGADEPLHTISAQGTHHGVMAPHLVKYYGCGEGAGIDEPCHTVTSKDRFGLVVEDMQPQPLTEAQMTRARMVASLLRRFECWDEREFVTVTIGGVEWVIVDIGLRMLTPRELYRAQGFPESYIIDRVPSLNTAGEMVWTPLTKTAQVRMCGNSVSPPAAAAIVLAQLTALLLRQRRTA